MDTAEPTTGGSTSPPRPEPWRGLSLFALALNGLGVLAGCMLLLSATSITNIAIVVIYLPAVALELLLLLPLALVAFVKERSLLARVLLLLTLVGSIGLAVAGTVINVNHGAKW